MELEWYLNKEKRHEISTLIKRLYQLMSDYPEHCEKLIETSINTESIDDVLNYLRKAVIQAENLNNLLDEPCY